MSVENGAPGCCSHGQEGGAEFCIFCLRARADGYYSALLAISEIEPCPCPCCGEHDAVQRAKAALEAAAEA